jgi:single-strand DNA-binding protein
MQMLGGRDGAPAQLGSNAEDKTKDDFDQTPKRNNQVEQSNTGSAFDEFEDDIPF